MSVCRERGFASVRTARALAPLFAVISLSFCLAISAAAAKEPARRDGRAFRDFIASLWLLAKDRGVSRATFEGAFGGVSFDPKVVGNTKKQAEFMHPIWHYVASAVSPERVQTGRGKAQEQSVWLAKANQTYGVDAGVIMGIWGLETDFGGFVGSDYVIRALASLAYVGFRGDYFRDELLSALIILQEGDIGPDEMRGSWAGAMGQTQFMPSSYLNYAVDFEGHGRRDIWTSAPDAIGSTANYLAKHGWMASLPWGFEVRLPAHFGLTDADSWRPAPFKAFAARGVERVNGAAWPASGEGRLLIPAGLKGPIFLVTGNFDVIKTYNNSTSYALAVALLGEAVKGGGALIGRWPTGDHPLSEAQVTRLQAKLEKMGYDVGGIDGKIGEALRSAVRAYQERNGLAPDGYADAALLKRLGALR